MSWGVMIFAVIGGAVLQAHLPAHTFLGQARFPFLLAVVLYYALNRDAGIMLACAFLAGFIQDALSLIPLGYSSACFSVAGWIAGRFRKMVITESPITSAFFGGTGALAVTLVFYLLLSGGELVDCSVGWAVWKAAGAGILGALCAPLVFFTVGGLDRLAGNVAIKESLDDVE